MSYDQDPATDSKQPPNPDLDLDLDDVEPESDGERIGVAHGVPEDDDDLDDIEQGVTRRTPKLPEREQEEAELAESDIMSKPEDDGEGPDA